MTEKEFIKRAMKLRPTVKEWRHLVETAIRSGCIDVSGVQDYGDIYPLAVAILSRLAANIEYGNANTKYRRRLRREVRNIKCFI